METLQRFAIFLPALLLALVLHEVAHAWVAYRCGDDTAKLAGRITMNPLAHLDVTGSIMMILSTIAGFGIGWAKPVPVNPLRFRHYRRDDILVSVAGVGANLLQALAWAGLYRLVRPYVLVEGDWAWSLASFTGVATIINLNLIVFNLIPIPPLDGSHVLFNLTRRDPVAVMRISQVGPLLLLGLLYFRALEPIFDYTVRPAAALLLGG